MSPLSANLYVQPSEGDAFNQPWRGDPLVIGRSSSADLVITDRYLSRRHARIYVKRDTMILEDLASANGTFLNGKRIRHPVPLRFGDVIRVSDSFVTFQKQMTKVVESDRNELYRDDKTILKSASDLLKEQLVATDSALKLNDKALQRHVECLHLINEIHQSLSQPMGIQETLELILDRVFSHIQPEQGVVFLRKPDGEFVQIAKRSVSEELPDIPLSTSLVHEVAEKGMAALVLDIATDERFSSAQSFRMAGIRSLMAAPMLDPHGTLGMIVLSYRAFARRFHEDEMQLLVSLASVAAMKVRNVALAEERAERQRLQEELRVARRIQLALLPIQLPELNGYDVHGDTIPSQMVAGDYFRAIERDEGREWVFVVADVSGKGVAASLLTAFIDALLASPVEDGLPPDVICAKASRLMFKRTLPERYASLFMAMLRPDSGELVFTNAGHNPPLLVRKSGAVEHLERTGLPLGLLRHFQYERRASKLEPGDMLVIYTDGLVETTNRSKELYGLSRLEALCLEHREVPLDLMADAIERDLEVFADGEPVHDDRTFLMVRRRDIES